MSLTRDQFQLNLGAVRQRRSAAWRLVHVAPPPLLFQLPAQPPRL